MNDLIVSNLKNQILQVENELAAPCTPAEAAVVVGTIVASYPQRNVNDADTYLTQLTLLVQSYPLSIAKRVAHPVEGVVARVKFLPAVAEVKAVADELWAMERGKIARAMMDIREQERQAEEQRREASLPSLEERQRMVDEWERMRDETADKLTIN